MLGIAAFDVESRQILEIDEFIIAVALARITRPLGILIHLDIGDQ